LGSSGVQLFNGRGISKQFSFPFLPTNRTGAPLKAINMAAKAVVQNFLMSPDFESAAVGTGQNCPFCGDIANGYKFVDIPHRPPQEGIRYNFDVVVTKLYGQDSQQPKSSEKYL
jgi:hypothetical protein